MKTTFDSPDRYGKGLDWEGYTVHDAANVFRRYLNDLPEPVVPLDLYEKFREPLRGATKQAVGDAEGPQFIDNFDERGAIAKYQTLITELPQLNRQLLLYILDLLAVFAAKSDENRMNSQNLAAIFQPGMLSHPTHAMAPEEYRLNQCVIIFLIENQDNFLIGMSGTAADEETKKEVESGPSAVAPATHSPTSKSGLGRSASNASAGAESVRRDGKIRRNRSTSSRHSRNDSVVVTPHSPALATTPTGGLTRSNTVPSKKSPLVKGGRLQKPGSAADNGSGHPPMPGGFPQSEATTPLEAPTPSEKPRAPPSIVPSVGTSGLVPASITSAARSQERLLEPLQDVGTPVKEKRRQNLFTRSPTNENERQPNKLKKKRMPGSLPSAQSSSASLTYQHSNAVSPNVEITNPMEQTEAANFDKPDTAVQTGAQSSNHSGDVPSELTPKTSQMASNNSSSNNNSSNLHPDQTLKPNKSPPTSLHSSFNEGSDIDHIDDQLALSADQPNKDKEKKRNWRLSRRKDENESPTQVPTSPKLPLGSNNNADISTTSIGKPRRSCTVESPDFQSPGVDPQSSFESTKERENKDVVRDDSKGLTGWIRNKYRERKESVARNKSPPADRGPDAMQPTRSFELRGKEGQSQPPAASPTQQEHSAMPPPPPPLQQP